MLTPVAPPGRSVSVLSIGRLLFGMLVLPRMPLVVLLLLCLLLQSCVALRIFWLEVAFCVFLCGIIFAHICWLSFRTATFKKNVLENIWPFPVVILVRVLSPQIGFGVCVRSVPSNRKLFSQPQFPVLRPSLNPVGKKNHVYRSTKATPLLKPDTSTIEWLLEKSKSFP
jgi:hypothetical protein